MPTSSQLKAQRWLQDLLEKKSDEDISIDLIRSIRDEANLLYERERICEMMDSDPFECFKEDEVKQEIERAKSMMNVISFSKNVNLNGSCELECTVEFKDNKMSDLVQDNVRLFFHYQRLPAHRVEMDLLPPTTEPTVPQNDDPTSKKRRYTNMEKSNVNEKKPENTLNPNIQQGTHISYSIEISCDYGERKPLLMAEIIALKDAPSIAPAVPMKTYDDLDIDPEEIKAEKSKDMADEYVAFLDPEGLLLFLSWTKLELFESVSLFFFLCFPFYENEWDLVNLMLDAILGDEDEDEDDWEDIDEDEAANNTMKEEEEDDDNEST